MTEHQVDVVVVGLGPGGESVATELARAGLDVVAVDRRLVGGECPYYGCIPSKMMVRASDVLAEARRVDGLAGRATVSPDWSPVHARIRVMTGLTAREISRMRSSENRMTDSSARKDAKIISA